MSVDFTSVADKPDSVKVGDEVGFLRDNDLLIGVISCIYPHPYKLQMAYVVDVKTGSGHTGNHAIQHYELSADQVLLLD